MAFLDFIKNRQQPSAEQSQPKPETAKEMYTRQATQEAVVQKTVANLADADKSQAKELGARIDGAAQNLQQTSPSVPQAPADATASPEAARQNMTAQDKEAPALSPTSGQMGTVEHEQEAPSPTPSRSQTMARTTPSWER